MVYRKFRTWVTVEPVVLMYMFASFLTYPTFQQLIYSSVCSMTPNCTDTTQANNRSSCANSSDPVEKEVRAEVSRWILYTNLAASIPAIIAALFYGSLSDLYGRKVFIVLPAFGGMLNAFLVIVVTYTVPDKMYLYLIGSFVSGLTGGYAVFNFAVYSYIADISTIARRTLKLSILESMTYFGAALSSFISGIWIEREGYILPFWGIFACYVLVILYTLFVLPPTAVSTGTTNNNNIQQSNNSDGDSFNTDNRHDTVIHNIKHLVTTALTSWRIALLCCIFFIVEINFNGLTDIIILYSINKLCWSSKWIGYFLGSKVFFNAISALVILPFLTIAFKAADTSIVFFGLVSSVGALVTMGTATQSWMMLLGSIIIKCQNYGNILWNLFAIISLSEISFICLY